MFDKSNLIYVSKCEKQQTFTNDKGVDVTIYKLTRSINDKQIESERVTKPFDIGYYYIRPFNKKITIVSPNGKQYETYVTICRVGKPYEFAI